MRASIRGSTLNTLDLMSLGVSEKHAVFLSTSWFFSKLHYEKKLFIQPEYLVTQSANVFCFSQQLRSMQTQLTRDTLAALTTLTTPLLRYPGGQWTEVVALWFNSEALMTPHGFPLVWWKKGSWEEQCPKEARWARSAVTAAVSNSDTQWAKI